MDQIKVGKFLAELRKSHGYTQQNLADELGVTGKTISRWENGHYMPDIEMLQILANEYGITITEILKGERTVEKMSVSIVDEVLVSAVRLDRKALRKHRDELSKQCIYKHRVWLIILAIVAVSTLFYSIFTNDYEAAITTVAFFSMTLLALGNLLSYHIEYELNDYILENIQQSDGNK